MIYRFRHGRSTRRGFTLLELIIVLALLAMLAAIVWPLLRNPLQRSVTQRAARQLVDDLARARLNAIETGRTMAFRYEPGGGRYSIAPADTLADGESMSARTEVQRVLEGEESGEEAGFELVVEAVLEAGVNFRDPEEAEVPDFASGSTLDAMLADEMAETEEVKPLIERENIMAEDSDTSWTAPVFIYPTGRAENASFVLRGPDNYSVTVTLRGLTGAVNIGPLEQERRVEDELMPVDESLAPLEDLAGEKPSAPTGY